MSQIVSEHSEVQIAVRDRSQRERLHPRSPGEPQGRAVQAGWATAARLPEDKLTAYFGPRSPILVHHQGLIDASRKTITDLEENEAATIPTDMYVDYDQLFTNQSDYFNTLLSFLMNQGLHDIRKTDMNLVKAVWQQAPAPATALYASIQTAIPGPKGAVVIQEFNRKMGLPQSTATTIVDQPKPKPVHTSSSPSSSTADRILRVLHIVVPGMTITDVEKPQPRHKQLINLSSAVKTEVRRLLNMVDDHALKVQFSTLLTAKTSPAIAFHMSMDTVPPCVKPQTP